MSRLLTKVLALISIFMLLGVFLVWLTESGRPVEPSSKEKINFVVNKGENFSQIAKNLKNQNLIRSPIHFKLVVIFSGRVKKIQAGSFTLSPSMNPLTISKILTKGRSDQRVTIVEGLRQEEIGEFLIKQGFDIQLRTWAKEIETQRLEGKLFPDTYFFSPSAGLGNILQVINRNFQRKVAEGLRVEIERADLTLEEVLTLASIVEREASRDEDRLLISGILLKRWQSGWLLQADATVQYAVASLKCGPFGKVSCDWWPKKLTQGDLKVWSPYNTYQVQGLPPTPICNPGLSSIKAVLHPQNSPYRYYLSDHNGEIYYAKTIEEHQANIQNYLLR